ncbi:YhgE/Pip domain-containing protein [Clostridium sp. AWRP]|uniref:YhgE/Pip domain-containing protein n=1 Tax=Clostridium sp. AWRP TaxID=2212991 RepID=UPI000FD9DC67|nr:YhgE/Pip domain-containing protein [Clostridium sp. AWRP]AZV55609.1 DUF3533 domain-containing protein [Clostridium sp. AWRP]
MNFFKVVWADIRNILSSKLMLLGLSAIICIPLIYGGMYLAAFWDPYSKTENIPVAVVNIDSGGKIDDKEVNYGNDIVNNLKDNKDLKWKFSKDLKNSKEYLEQGKYYAMFIIPKDFTKRMVQADKGILEKPNLIFVTNKKKNYVVGLISDKAAIAVKDSINKSMIYNIGIKVYDSMYELRDGMESASNGTSQIKDGVTDMKDAVPSMENGMDKLYNGASTLTNKINDAADGSNELRDGLGTLNGKMPDLIDGVNKLLKGSSTITDKIGDAADGSKSLRNGINSLSGKIPDLSDGIDKLYDGSTSLQDGLHEMDDNMPDLVDGVGKLKDGSKQLKDGLDQVKSGVGDAESTAKVQIEKNRQYIVRNVYPEVQRLTYIASTVDNQIPDNSNLKPISQIIVYNLQLLQGQLKDLADGGELDYSKIMGILNNTNSYLQSVSTSIESLMSKLDKSSNTYAVCSELDTQVKFLESTVSNIKSALESVKQLIDGIDKLDAGAKKLNDGLGELYDKTEDLKDGTDTLYNGSQNLTDGIGRLKDSVPELSNGVSTLYDGSVDLSDGLFKIQDGSKTLTDKLGELNNKVPDVESGVQKLYDGSTDLSDGLFKLYDGSGTLRDGIKTLKDKIPDLQDGVNKLYEGVAELHDKLADGAEKLSDKMVPSSKDMGNFMSSPLNVKDKPLYDVGGYGQGLAPYFISLGIWVGALLMFFLISENVNPNLKIKLPARIIGKYLSYCAVGTIQAVLLSAAVMALGLKPSNVTIYFTFNIFLSFVFIAIIQNFVFLFGDAGRLMAIIALILQLTSSNGTFPGELLPKFFKTIGPFLPFTYSISAMREIDWGIDYSVLQNDVIVLSIFLAASLICSLVFKKYSIKFNLILDLREIEEKAMKENFIEKR